MNKRISVTVLIAFFIVFSSLFVFNNTFSEISTEKFYSQDFDTQKKKILIYGSSHVFQLNNTYINNQISKNFENYIVYNMGENADTPKRRWLNVQNDISLNPELIFYGITFRDFSTTSKNENQFTDFKLTNLLPDDLARVETINPKLTTLEVLRGIVIDVLAEESKKDVPYPNNPAFSEKPIERILTYEELQSYPSVIPMDIPLENNEELGYFKKILDSYNDENIKVIVFINPHHRTALDAIPSVEKTKFFEILSKIEKEYDVKIFDFSEKYADLQIWRDPTHVAYNSDAIIFSEDMAKLIIQEIEK
jgi:hypothetical protein